MAIYSYFNIGEFKLDYLEHVMRVFTRKIKEKKVAIVKFQTK